MAKPRLWTRDFIGIWFCNFLVFTSFYALVTSLPMYVTDVLRGGKQQIGLVMTSFLIAADRSRIHNSCYCCGF